MDQLERLAERTGIPVEKIRDTYRKVQSDMAKVGREVEINGALPAYVARKKRRTYCGQA